MFHQVVEDFEQLDLWIFTLVLAGRTQAEIHKESSRVLDAVVAERVSFVSKHSGDPLNHIQLNHDGLRLLAERELLQSSQSILPETGISVLRMEDSNKNLNQVRFL